jgi:hypothetical protein
MTVGGAKTRYFLLFLDLNPLRIPPTPQAHLSAMIGFGSNDKELVGKLRSQNLIAVVPNDYLLAQRYLSHKYTSDTCD